MPTNFQEVTLDIRYEKWTKRRKNISRKWFLHFGGMGNILQHSKKFCTVTYLFFSSVKSIYITLLHILFLHTCYYSNTTIKPFLCVTWPKKRKKIKAIFYLFYALKFVKKYKDTYFSTWIWSNDQSQYRNAKYSFEIYNLSEKNNVIIKYQFFVKNLQFSWKHTFWVP